MKQRVRIGTSGYSYPGPAPQGWYGVFYPEKKAKKFDELAFYSSFFDSVEINSTFYRPPAPGIAEAWAKRSPADFEFAVKVWQKFTHPMKLGEETGEKGRNWEAPTQADVELFKRGVGPLSDCGKLGVLLFQYPPGFHYSEENAEKLGWTLDVFKDYPKAVELRHRSWSDKGAETKRLLGQCGATWAVIDEPKFASSVVQGFEPMGNIFYLRLHGRNREKWWSHKEAWERYDYFYGPEEIRSLAGGVGEAAEKSPRAKIYVLFNNHARGQAVADAVMLKRELGQEVAAALPESLVRAYPQLAGFGRVQDRDTLF